MTRDNPPRSDSLEGVDEDEVLTTQEAADYLGISKSRMKQYVRAKRIKGRLTSAGWLFPRSEVVRLRSTMRKYTRRDPAEPVAAEEAAG